MAGVGQYHMQPIHLKHWVSCTHRKDYRNSVKNCHPARCLRDMYVHRTLWNVKRVATIIPGYNVTWVAWRQFRPNLAKSTELETIFRLISIRHMQSCPGIQWPDKSLEPHLQLHNFKIKNCKDKYWPCAGHEGLNTVVCVTGRFDPLPFHRSTNNKAY